ncbi:MAG: hypothetical protein II781_01295 [Clostridia bacterium]|nr:hypothetical protein [Clostridia bacterium]
MKRILSIVLVCVMALLMLAGCSHVVDEAQYIGTIFDGQAVLRAYGPGSQAALSTAFEQMQIAQRNTLEENGDFTAMYAAQNQMQAVSPFTVSMLSRVLDMQNQYADLYAQARKKPEGSQYCFSSLQVNPAVNAASMQCSSTYYLKALARAAAIDNAAQTIVDEGAMCGMVMLAGTTATIGKRPDDGSWAMPVTHPLDQNLVIGTLYLKNLSASTMAAPLPEKAGGDTAERALSVTIIAPTALEATVLSCFLYGLDIQYTYNMVSAMDGIDILVLGENGTILSTQKIDTNLR